MIGGFHFNDRRYADDDLTLGSIDPYQIFRIFHEIHTYAWETGAFADVAYMVDQSHNLKGKMEAMIQTVCTAQELYAKAAIVDHARLAPLQQSCSLVEAEETLRGAFWYDVRPVLREWRRSHGLPEDPMQAFRDRAVIWSESRPSAKNTTQYQSPLTRKHVEAGRPGLHHSEEILKLLRGGRALHEFRVDGDG